MKKFLVLTMGGTIDAEPFSASNYPVYSTVTNDNLALKALKEIAANNIDHIAICNKDSKDLNNQDVEKLIHTIQNAKNYERIIVTLGTDRMTGIAREIKQQIDSLPVPVVFTGAIWPLANGPQSDGWNNLEKAVLAKIDETDVYIAMGDVFIPAEYAEKDFKARKFVDLRHKGST